MPDKVYPNRRVSVTCIDCGASWMKQASSLPAWQGRCRSCAAKLRRTSIANLTPTPKGPRPGRRGPQPKRRGANTWNWKGGKPKCVDCGAQVSTYKVKRCRPCEYAERHRRPTPPHWAETHPQKRGEDSPFWKGGGIHRISMSAAVYRDWRRAVFDRDGRRCVLCGTTDGPFDVDHIIAVSERPDLVTDIGNGRVLCRPCHKQTPNYGHKQRIKLHGK